MDRSPCVDLFCPIANKSKLFKQYLYDKYQAEYTFKTKFTHLLLQGYNK